MANLLYHALHLCPGEIARIISESKLILFHLKEDTLGLISANLMENGTDLTQNTAKSTKNAKRNCIFLCELCVLRGESLIFPKGNWKLTLRNVI